MPAYANGQRFLVGRRPEAKVFFDPDASWGNRSSISTRKGGGYYCYKLHAAVCSASGLSVAWRVESAPDAEAPVMPMLLDAVRSVGIDVENVIAGKGYDAGPVYDECESRGIRPIIPLRQTSFVGEGQAADVRGRSLDVRRLQRQPRRFQVAVPDRGVPTGLPVDQGRPAAHAGAPRHGPLMGPLPHPRPRRL